MNSRDIPQAFQDERLINTDAAARLLGISFSWLTKARMTGEGPVFTKIGRRVLYQPSALWTWLQTHQRRSTSEAA